MVKRQTVWLSTMMVLSLMLIGYYTLGTPGTPGSSGSHGSQTATPGVQTTVTGRGANPAANKTAQTNATVPASASAQKQPSDWFVQMQLQDSNQQSKLIQTLQGTLSDPRASNAVVSAAYQELTQLQTQQANASRIHDLLLGMNYPDSLVFFNPHGRVQVYVEASTLSPTQAVQVINLVSQTLGAQSNLITVSNHA